MDQRYNARRMANIILFTVFLSTIKICLAGIGDCSDPPYFFGYNNPILPASLPAAASIGNIATDRLIPRHIWIAIRNKSDDRPSHILGFAKKNSNWLIHYADNEDKDRFMETVYANTSLLWAYNIVNPVIGVSKSEIWRLAVLYVYGGLYMDDDANLGTKLDEIVRPTDQFIISQEYYQLDERCFIDDYHLSNKSFVKRYGADTMSQVIFGNKFIANWAMFSAPRHPVIKRTIEYAVELIRYEFLGQSKITVSWNGERTDGRKLMCCTTHPLIYACRALVLEKLVEMSGGGNSNTTGVASASATATTAGAARGVNLAIANRDSSVNTTSMAGAVAVTGSSTETTTGERHKRKHREGREGKEGKEHRHRDVNRDVATKDSVASASRRSRRSLLQNSIDTATLTTTALPAAAATSTLSSAGVVETHRHGHGHPHQRNHTVAHSRKHKREKYGNTTVHAHYGGASDIAATTTTATAVATTAQYSNASSVMSQTAAALQPTQNASTSAAASSTAATTATASAPSLPSSPAPVHTTITTAATVTEKDKEIEKKVAIEQTGMMSSKELEAAAAALGIRVVRPFFSDYGGQMKAWYNDWKPNHWVKLVRRHNPYMRAHITNAPSYLEGKPVKLHGGRSIYYVQNCTKREFPSFEAFRAMKFDLDNVITVLSETLDKIPLGPPMPSKP